MRRPLRYFVAALALLGMLFGGYGGYWFIAAGRITDAAAGWAQRMHARRIDVSWQKIRVGGFPAGFRVTIDRAVLRDRRLDPGPRLRVPVLSASARPWDFSHWRFEAPHGFAAKIAGAAGRLPATLTARRAAGSIAVDPAGGMTLTIRAHEAVADAGDPVAMARAEARLTLPATPPRSRTDPLIGLAFRLHRLRLPQGIVPLGRTIADLDVAATVEGAIPPGPLVPAIATWRNAGGTVELDNLQVRWGPLGARASGTLSLDRRLQPVGTFSGAIEGYDQILTALVHSGRLRAQQAGLAKLVLTMLAKTGPDGKPQLATSFTIQDGEMYLGPARLGPAPRIAWE